MKTTEHMARESWIDVYGLGKDKAQFLEALKHFEALVRNDEREVCAKVCDEEKESFMRDAYGSDDGRYDWKADGAMNCADAIRARSNT